MYRIFILYLVAFCSFFDINGAERYYLQGTNNSFNCEVFLTEDVYEISTSVYLGHQGLTVPFSLGVVYKHNDTLFFRDIINKFEMKAIYKPGKSLEFINGFKALHDVMFVYTDCTERVAKIRSESILAHFSSYKNKSTLVDSLLYHAGHISIAHKKLFRLNNGHYIFPSADKKNNDIVFENIIIKDNRYQYLFNDIVLTEGEWRTIGEYVMFKDETLGTYFIGKMLNDNYFSTLVFPSPFPSEYKLE